MILGPILRFLGADPQENTWRVSCLIVISGSDAPPPLTWSIGKGKKTKVEGVEIATHRDRRVITYAIEAPRGDDPRAVDYRLGAGRGAPGSSFKIPARGERPRSAFASCCGFSSLKAMKTVNDKYERWRDLLTVHAAAPYHLLILGGDQVYADPLWESIRGLEEWNEQSPLIANVLPMKPELAAEIDDFYFDLYLHRWAQPDYAAALASVPTIMMWDDHDIFDGWGSYPPLRQSSPVFQGIFAVARRWFRAFQLHLGEGSSPELLVPERGLTYAYRIDDIAILALDLRSERSQEHVMSPESWRATFSWLEGQQGLSHLMVVSSIPVVFPDLTRLQDLLGRLPGEQELEDDLRDHWYSRAHQGERLRLIHRLLDHARDRRARVTLLSGDVHVPGLGLIESTRPGDGLITISQLISSALVHPPPPASVVYALDKIMSERGEFDRGITASMQSLPGTRRRLICARNWMSIEPDDATSWPSRRRLWVHWRIEGETEPYTTVIAPLDPQ